MEGITIHIMRHAQAEHNVAGEMHLVDPDLTAHGVMQCATFAAAHAALGARVTHVVSSPSQHCFRTAVLAFQPFFAGAGAGEVVLHPDLQEFAVLPCHIPRPVDEIEDLGGEYVDTTLLEQSESSGAGPSFRSRAANSPWRLNVEAARERARRARRWLRDLGRRHRDAAGAGGDDAEVAVVTHEAFALFLTQSDVVPWGPAQMRSYRFVSADDADAALEEIRDGGEEDDGQGPPPPPPPPPSGGPPGRSILKRKRDDDDDDDADDDEGTGGAKRRKTVSWRANLTDVRTFALSLTVDEGHLGGGGDDGALFWVGVGKTRYPTLDVSRFSGRMRLRARQIVRHAERFPHQELFPADVVAGSRLIGSQACDSDDEDSDDDEEAFPAAWDLEANPGARSSDRGVAVFLGKYKKLLRSAWPKKRRGGSRTARVRVRQAGG
ncbi:histidine phosphatase superfamily [Xylariaceae sp. FL0804]|nr:histidine phosphatase superfamily [Xylariaceae sp. FL0804]